jgi:hypothetical protein
MSESGFRILVGLASGAAMLIAADVAQAQTIGSFYTRHDFEKCALVRDDDPVTERRCEGHAGIPVFWVNEPDSSSIAFGIERLVGDGYDERFTFAVAGDTIEWRGPRRGAGVDPYAAIVRFQLCRSIGGPCRPELVLFRLEGARRSCIAASVAGGRADANARARALADSFVRNFRCGTDRPRRSG